MRLTTIAESPSLLKQFPMFVMDPLARMAGRYQTVVLDVEKVNQDLALDKGFYVGPGGTGAGITGRYQEFQSWKLKGEKIECPRAVLADDGYIAIVDGRHRFAVLRDEGHTSIPMTVPKYQAAQIKARYGTMS